MYPRWLLVLWLSALTLPVARFSAAEPVRCYLVDSRVHVAIVDAGPDATGQICWRDTVTGESGEVPFTQSGPHLHLQRDGAGTAIARLVADVAIVVEHPPWRHADTRLSLGFALN